MKTIDHYENHLSKFYSWMTGDIEEGVKKFEIFLTENNITSKSNANAVDLGAGHGIQSIALKRAGFNVTAVDFSQTLLEELKLHPEASAIKTINKDIKKFSILKN